MTKHTPGPWEMVRHGSAGRYLVTGTQEVHGSPWVISIALTRSGSDEEANARLIAAAPDLLAALLATIEREEHYGACELCGAPKDEVPDLCPLGRRLSDRVQTLRPAAIARAEGR